MGNSNSKAGQGFLGGILMVGGIVATIATGGAAAVVTGPLILSGGSMMEDAINRPNQPPNYTIGAGVTYSNDGHGTMPYVGDHTAAQIIRENIANDDANRRSQEQMKKDIEKQKQEELNKKVNDSVSNYSSSYIPLPVINTSYISTTKSVNTNAPKIMTMNDVENATSKYKSSYNRNFIREFLRIKIETDPKGLTKEDLNREIKNVEKSKWFNKELEKTEKTEKQKNTRMRSIYGEAHSHIMKNNKKEASKLTTAQRISNVEHIASVGEVLTGHKSGIAGLAVSAAMHPIQHYNEKHRPRTSTENNIKASASLATLATNPYVGAFITSSLIASELKEATKHLEDSIAKKVVTKGVMREFERKYYKIITKAELKKEVEKELKIFEKVRHTNAMME